MSRPTRYRRPYYGAEIGRVTHSGMWTAHVDVGTFYVPLMADSWQGIREIIRETRRAHGLPVIVMRGDTVRICDGEHMPRGVYLSDGNGGWIRQDGRRRAGE